SLGVDVYVKVPRLDRTDRASLFHRLPLGGLAMRQPRFRSALRKSPLVPAVGFDQQEFGMSICQPIANCGHLQRQRVSSYPMATHVLHKSMSNIFQFS